MALIFMSLASVITVIGRVRIVAGRWVWRVIFPIFTTVFLLIVLLFLWWRFWWWFFRCRVWRWWFWVRVIWYGLFLFSENSVGCVSGLLSFSRVNGIFSFSRVIGIFSFSKFNWIFSSCQVKYFQVKSCQVKWIFSRLKTFLVSNPEF